MTKYFFPIHISQKFSWANCNRHPDINFQFNNFQMIRVIYDKIMRNKSEEIKLNTIINKLRVREPNEKKN